MIDVSVHGGDDIVLLADATLRKAADVTKRLFSVRSSIDTPELDARLLVCMAGRTSHVCFIGDPDRRLSLQQAIFLQSLTERRLAGEPVARILGYREFWGRKFCLGTETLVPRPDSELLIDAALAWIATSCMTERPVIADLGTGSGCLLVTLLAELPESWGVGIDISRETLKIAFANAVLHGVSNRVSFVQADFALSLSGKFDMIVVNPPYIERGQIPFLQDEVAVYDPLRAIDGGYDGLDAIRKVMQQIRPVMKEGGSLLLEIGAGQSECVLEIMRDLGFNVDVPSDFLQDSAGHVRVMRAVNKAYSSEKSLGVSG